MAGTVPSLSLSMQFDNATQKPLAGGKLFFFAANTSTPQNAFKDTGLTLAHPNPITLDGAGRVPEFYLADGSIRVRLTNKNGVVQFDATNTLVIGASSGSGGSGTSVDETTIFQTGDFIWNAVSGTRSGWVRANGRTIGNATSGASERANADTSDLYSHLWQNFTDDHCPVAGGRGASASADFSASKQITLPDLRGRSMFGLDDMGNTAASRFTGVPFTSGDSATSAAGTGGESQHTLTNGELAPHTHSTTVTDPGHQHTEDGVNGTVQNAGTITGGGNAAAKNTLTGSSTTGITVAVNTAGGASPPGGAAHNNTPNFMLGTVYIKL